MTDTESLRYAGPPLARWRPLLELLSLGLQVALLLTTIGICVSAIGTREADAGNAWGRVDEIAGRIAVWEYPAAIAVGLLMVLLLRLLFEWPRDVPGGRARAALVLALVNLGCVAAAAVLGTIAVYLAEFPETRRFFAEPFYNGTERAGETVYNLGIVAAVGVLSVLAGRGFSIVRSRAAPPPMQPVSLASDELPTASLDV